MKIYVTTYTHYETNEVRVSPDAYPDFTSAAAEAVEYQRDNEGFIATITEVTLKETTGKTIPLWYHG